jgi:hypothetical protein
MIIKILPDKEKAKSILRLVKDREEFLPLIDIEKFPTIAAENYYEIIKELITTLLIFDGIKTLGENAHKELVECLSKYKEFDEKEIRAIDDLRIRRNKSLYEGMGIDTDYIKNKKVQLVAIINKLKEITGKRLNI